MILNLKRKYNYKCRRTTKIEEILGPEGEIPVPVKSPTERKEITKILTKPKFGEYLKQNPVVATELVYKMVPGVGNPGTQITWWWIC